MFRTFALLVSVSAACSTTSTPDHPERSATAAAAPTAVASCVAALTRARTCSDAFVPALVDARARHDVPAGIAAAVAADRAGMIAQARAEWAVDSTDASIAQTCADAGGDVATADADCAAATDCAAFATCAIRGFEASL
jgi:hypothetical protein